MRKGGNFCVFPLFFVSSAYNRKKEPCSFVQINSIPQNYRAFSSVCSSAVFFTATVPHSRRSSSGVIDSVKIRSLIPPFRHPGAKAQEAAANPRLRRSETGFPAPDIPAFALTAKQHQKPFFKTAQLLRISFFRTHAAFLIKSLGDIPDAFFAHHAARACFPVHSDAEIVPDIQCVNRGVSVPSGTNSAFSPGRSLSITGVQFRIQPAEALRRGPERSSVGGNSDRRSAASPAVRVSSWRFLSSLPDHRDACPINKAVRPVFDIHAPVGILHNRRFLPAEKQKAYPRRLYSSISRSSTAHCAFV